MTFTTMIVHGVVAVAVVVLPVMIVALRSDNDDIIKPTFFTVTFCVFAVMVFISPEAIRNSEANITKQSTDRVELVSLSNGTANKTTAYLTHSQTNQKNVYRYMMKDGDSYVMDEIDAGTPIKQDSTPETAHIEITKCVYNEVLYSLIATCEDEAVIHVPEGSITEDFTVDVSKNK